MLVVRSPNARRPSVYLFVFWPPTVKLVGLRVDILNVRMARTLFPTLSASYAVRGTAH